MWLFWACCRVSNFGPSDPKSLGHHAPQWNASLSNSNQMSYTMNYISNVQSFLTIETAFLWTFPSSPVTLTCSPNRNPIKHKNKVSTTPLSLGALFSFCSDEHKVQYLILMPHWISMQSFCFFSLEICKKRLELNFEWRWKVPFCVEQNLCHQTGS